MSKRAIIVSAAAGFVLGSLVAAAPARVESTSTQVDQMTCEAFLAMHPDDHQRIASWVDGYQTAKGDAAVGAVAFDMFGKPIGALVDECTMAPKETLWQTLTKRLSIGPRDGSVKRWQPCTPAMAAGCTDHVWTRQEGLLFRVPPWPQPHIV